jgi:alcohol dehydrogenase YqhD (iron-dependent ADH family)
MEQYLHNDTDVDVSDGMTLGVMKAVVKWAPVAVREPENYDARANLLWASSIAMNRILSVGHYENWVSHLIEHSLSAKYSITHGAGMAIVLSKYLKYSVKFDELNRIGKMGRYVFDLEQEDADEAILRFEEFITSLGLPLTLKDLVKVKIEEQDLELLVKNSLPFGEMKLEGFEPFGYQEAREIIESCI